MQCDYVIVLEAFLSLIQLSLQGKFTFLGKYQLEWCA